MKLAKIKNKYMYKTSPNDNGSHYYLIFYNHKEKRYEAAQLTHLYIRDNKRFAQVKKGNILVEKFKEFDVPSGIHKMLYTHSYSGSKISLSNKGVIQSSLRQLSTSQSKRIKKFLFK